VTDVRQVPDGVEFKLTRPGEGRDTGVDVLLVSIGIEPVTDSLGLDEAG